MHHKLANPELLTAGLDDDRDGWSGFADRTLTRFGGGGSKKQAAPAQPTANYTLPNVIPQAQQGMAGSIAAPPTYGSYGWQGQNPFGTGMQMAAMRANGMPTGGLTPQSTGQAQSYFGGGSQLPAQQGMFQGIPQTTNVNSYAPQPTPKAGGSGGTDWGSILGAGISLLGLL